MQFFTMCIRCSGSGKIPRWILWTKDCSDCGGRGKVPKAASAVPSNVTHATLASVKREGPATASAVSPNDDGDIVAGALLVVASLSGHEDAAPTHPKEVSFHGGGGGGGGAGAHGTWDEPAEKATEPETVSVSEPDTSSFVADSPGSPDMGLGDST